MLDFCGNIDGMGASVVLLSQRLGRRERGACFLSLHVSEQTNNWFCPEPRVAMRPNPAPSPQTCVGQVNWRRGVLRLRSVGHGKKDLSFSKYELLFKKKINPIFINVKEFKNMLKDKILIRNCANFKFLSDKFIRIAIKNSKNNNYFTEKFKYWCNNG